MFTDIGFKTCLNTGKASMVALNTFQTFMGEKMIHIDLTISKNTIEIALSGRSADKIVTVEQ